ncbi:T9SS type A sorting domain-containing protein [Psychroserpens sp.]|uniref:T9SS type A sorting domain-containing protein n=1 Tax=Psychroserpens sp. TaxID=2020870 RepID=UPI002B268279|nr:T9SS type A sorting domain-containing protein [Psychroserpens sp.]
MKKITLLFLLSISFSFGQVLSEDFEAGLAVPLDWTNNDIAGGGETWTVATGGEAVGFAPPNTLYYDNTIVGNYALFDSDGFGGAPSPAEEAALESPAFDATTIAGTIQLSFDNFFTAGYGGAGFVEVYDGFSWIQVASYAGADQNASSIGLVEIDVTAELAAATNAQVRFRWVGDYAWGWAIDNVVVDQGPSCFVPSDFVAESITSTTFELSWMDANPGTSMWEFEIGPELFTQGTGTPITGVTGSPYTFMGLTPNTVYDFYMRTNCDGGNGDSDWVGPLSFRTSRDCVADASSTFNTNDFVDDTILDCFDFEDTDGISPIWSFNTGINDLDGDGATDQFLVVFPQGAGETEKDDWLFSPQINMTAGNNYPISVIYNAFDLNSVANESFELLIVDEQSSTAAYQNVLGTYSNVAQSGVFGDTGGNDLITQANTAFETFSPPGDGAYYVAVRATSTGSANLLMVLNIIVDETLSLTEFDSNNFSYSYNKNTDQLTLESSNSTFDAIEMFSILGQNVISRKLSNQNEVIDLSSLTDGVYLATININGNSKTIKILKQ